ncbi:MAG TPA: hypothetical protein VHD32_15480 [Candidatus Didemnitutus sp.]|jgi:hypothetical protein|nr:hypothetical protein [Candidatus Didemnitutus sp.]
MTRVSKLMAMVLLALWMPATQHCALEAVGALITTCTDNCATGESPDKDGCGSIESGNFKPSGAIVKAPAPSLFACAFHLCLQLAPQAHHESISLIGCAVVRADAWIPTWQFVRRAAPLPGAPSLSLA